MEAMHKLAKSEHTADGGTHTLEELLAGVLLEESIVDDGTCQIVDHKLGDRLNLFLGVAGVELQSCVLQSRLAG